MRINRFLTLVLLNLVAATGIALAAEAQNLDPSQARRSDDGATLWYDARELAVEGQGWSDTLAAYDRLPARAEDQVRSAVWNLSRHSSGIAIRFMTDASQISAQWSLTSSRLAMPHMPATGASGVDLYVRDEQGTWRWLACGQPKSETNSVVLVRGIPRGMREYLMYLPRYNGVTSVEVGVTESDVIALPPPRLEGKRKPIVFYGTSITHGASASRPGMVHPAILGRRFDRPVINLGFSGNGRMETEVVELIAELDAAVFVIDCLPNIGAKEVLARTKPCVAILRRAHPQTPIVLVEDRSYGDAFLVTSKRERNRTSREALRKMYEELKAAGDEQLFYLTGDQLLGDDNEGTVDSSHPTDLGFMRQADAFAEVLEPLLVGAN